MSWRVGRRMLVALLLSGCSGDQDMRDLESFVNEVKAREPSPIEPLPEIKQVETFAYAPADRRDPFRAGQEETSQEIPSEANAGIAPDPLRRKEELEQFPLDSLRMVGTLEQGQTIWGLIAGKDGTLFRVRPGNYMGQNHGQIVRIGEERIELTEIISDGQGGWQERQAAVALSE